MDRKEIVTRLRDALGVTPKYLGAPNFLYEIQTEDETYIIDRDGTIKNSAGEEVSMEMIPNVATSDPETTTLPEPVKLEELPVEGFEVSLPLEGHTGITLRNIVNMLSSKQRLIMKSFNLTELLIDEDFAGELSKRDTDTIETFKESFLVVGPEKSPGLIFDFENDTFTFRLIADNLDPDKMKAFKDLAVFINENAKKLKHASYKPAQEDNPKFAMRTWLTRLGINGPEYKTTRKALLANLGGNGAFRKAGEKDE